MAPLLKAWPVMLEEYNIETMLQLQATCTLIDKAIAERCLGPAPIKPTNWTRKPRDCTNRKREACVKLNAFLVDPDRESETFQKIEHVFNERDCDLKQRGSHPFYFKGPRTYTKTCDSWDREHRALTQRFDRVRRTLPSFESVKRMFGEDAVEVQEVLWKGKMAGMVGNQMGKSL